MNLKRATRWTAALLALLGLTCMFVRYHGRRQERLDPGDTLWRVTYHAKFQATHLGAELRMASPSDTSHAKVYHEDLLYTGLTATHLRSSRQPAKEISLLAGRTGQHEIVARFDVQLSPKSQFRGRDTASPKTQAERDQYLKTSPTLPIDDQQVRLTLSAMAPDAGLDPIKRITEFCANAIQSDEDGPSDASEVLKRKSGSSVGRARAMVTLCRALRVPARLVTGFSIDEEVTELPVKFWVEILTAGGWTPYDPAGAFAKSLPTKYVPVRRDGSEIMNGTEISELNAGFALTRLPPGPGATRFGHTNIMAILDLTRLPLEMHEPLSIILLMPLGALVTALFRTVIGAPTFGTFTPTLLALSFVYANWETGLLMFVIVLTLGLTSRTFLDRLKLLLVPRLGAMLTLVVMMIVFTVSVLDYFNLTPSAQAVILPMVILTMTVERFYLTSEEDSPAYALQLLATTVLVGVCCYLVLRWNTVGRFVLAYPETHFFTIAIMVLLGRYSGYRLTELWRFRDLVEPPE